MAPKVVSRKAAKKAFKARNSTSDKKTHRRRKESYVTFIKVQIEKCPLVD